MFTPNIHNLTSVNLLLWEKRGYSKSMLNLTLRCWSTQLLLWVLIDGTGVGRLGNGQTRSWPAKSVHEEPILAETVSKEDSWRGHTRTWYMYFSHILIQKAYLKWLLSIINCFKDNSYSREIIKLFIIKNILSFVRIRRYCCMLTHITGPEVPLIVQRPQSKVGYLHGWLLWAHHLFLTWNYISETRGTDNLFIYFFIFLLFRKSITKLYIG